MPITSQHDLDAIANREDVVITDCSIMSDHLVELICAPKTGFNRPNRNSSVVVAASITAQARVEMDRAIRKCYASGVKIYYSDTDSLIIGLPAGVTNPLNMGTALFQFKNEYPDCQILSFYSLGPKLYQMQYKNLQTNEIVSESKQKGFFLKSTYSKEIVHDTLYKEFVEALLVGETKAAVIGQFQIRTSRKYDLFSCITQKILRNNTFSKRVICGSTKGKISFCTLPYGFTTAMFIEEIQKEKCCLCRSLDMFIQMANCVCHCHMICT